MRFSQPMLYLMDKVEFLIHAEVVKGLVIIIGRHLFELIQVISFIFIRAIRI